MAEPAPLDPTIIVIFGVTGDLSQRYLLPSLYHLIKDGRLHQQTEIIGVTRQPMTADELLNKVELCVNEIDNVCDPVALQTMHEHTRMFQMDPVNPDSYRRLLAAMNLIEAEKGMCLNRLYYLSIPPQIYGPVIQLMGESGLNRSCQHDKALTRLLVEKPFGYDLASAEELIRATGKVFREDQLFRIDHYLAKETVQNILTFRRQLPDVEALWNRQAVSRIEISASEQLDISGREQFYEPVGALRDFIQSHLLQILGIITMELPDGLDSQRIHRAKCRALEQVLPVPANAVAAHTVRGQYSGYRQQVHNDDSTTETLAGIRVYMDSDRWRDVPIIIWTGKALAKRQTQVQVAFHSPPGGQPNCLRFNLQPNTGISLDMNAPDDRLETSTQTAIAEFSLAHTTDYEHPTAYERVLTDAVSGDHTLFATSDEVLAAWHVVEPVIREWSKSSHDLSLYPKGADAQPLVERLYPE